LRPATMILNGFVKAHGKLTLGEYHERLALFRIKLFYN
jgi:hypothetical protein